jgi:ABC-type multidrug transport system ATPase subunit
MDQRLKNYSSGMQVRLAFSVAIRAQADILLVDEVLAVGDADFQRKCYEYFKTLKSNKQTVVFVSHDMAAVREYCDRVALIDMSKLVGIYSAETAAKKYMQLFAKDEQEQSTKQTKRWGNKKAMYKNVKSQLVDDQKNIMLDITVEAKEAIADPTYGFKVSNEANQPILGTNNQIEQVKVKPLKAGEQFSFKWKFPNMFNQGKYYIELVLMYNSVTVVADWWENAASFSVTNDKKTPYIVNPHTEFLSD